MDWNDLRHFLAVYRQRSLAGAARELGCEYTTVGRRIGALEETLGTRLFTRARDGMSPTPAADSLMPLAESVERATQAIERRIGGLDERIDGTVKVTCPDGFDSYLVTQLQELRARHPELRVEIVADFRTLDLLRGDADIAVRMTATTQPDLLVRKLCDIKWLMFASDAYVERHGVPSPIENLRGHEIVGFGPKFVRSPGTVWLDAHQEGATVACRCNTLHAVVQATQAGIGLTVIPQHLGTLAKLRLLAPDVLGSRSISLVVHPDLAKVARIRTVMTFLADAILRDHAAEPVA